MNKEELEKLKELAEKATQEPWDALQCYGDEFENYIGLNSWVDDGKWVCACRFEKDARFIHAANPAVVLGMIAKIERLEKEADWLAKNCQGADQCPYLAHYWHLKGDIRPEWCDCLDNGEEFDCDQYEPDCWRKAAREAVEAQCKTS